jgi:hypothetical protein
MGTDLSSTVIRTLRELGVGMDGTDRLSRHARSFARHRMGIGQRDAQLTEARHTAHNDAGARNRGNVALTCNRFPGRFRCGDHAAGLAVL